MKTLFLTLLFLSLSLGGEELYKKYCSSCHGEDRLGKSAPPLLPLFFMSKSDDYLYQVIKNGTIGMPSFENLKEEEIKAIVNFIKKPIDEEKIEWGADKVKEETQRFKKVEVKRQWDYTLVVERGKNLLWIMEGYEVLEKIPFSDIHGGIKFSKDGDIYIPSRSGWVGKYSPKDGKLKKVRACIYLRNIALSSDGEVLSASCWLPSSLVLFDKNLNLLEIKKVEGRINAIYELNIRDGFIFTFRDKPYVGFLDVKSRKINYKKLDTTLEDFTLDPFEEYLIGTTKGGLRIYTLEGLNPVKTLEISGLPHLASAYFWYSKGEFYFATPIIGKPVLSVWKAYGWEHVKDIPLKGMGFLARSNYGTPYVWVDESSDTIALIDKRSLEVKRIKPFEGKRATHTEISGDGRLAYISLYEREGSLVIYDGVGLEKLKEHPASLPAGKYNYVNKSRRLDSAQLGYQVFMEKCWGCHHTTRQAFGPPLKDSAQKRDKALIMAQIIDPENTHQLLGYTRNAMPPIKLREEEIKALMSFIYALREDWEE